MRKSTKKTTFIIRPAKRKTPPPADGNIYREIVRDRVAARFGQAALDTAWSIDLPDPVMLDPAGPITQAFDRLDTLRLARIKLSKTAEREIFLLFVKQWQQGYMGRWYVEGERNRKVGRKTAAANRRKKAEIDADRAQSVIGIYQRVRKPLEPGHRSDLEARRIVAARWEASTGFPITDRTIRNILDGNGISRHRRPLSDQ